MHIELLTRMKLHITAAYLRKHSALPEIRSATNVRNFPIPSGRSLILFCFSASDNCLYVLREVRKGYPRSARRFNVRDLQIPSSAVLNLVRFSSVFFLQTMDSKHIVSLATFQSNSCSSSAPYAPTAVTKPATGVSTPKYRQLTFQHHKHPRQDPR